MLYYAQDTISARFLPRHHFAKYQQSGSGAKKLADELQYKVHAVYEFIMRYYEPACWGWSLRQQWSEVERPTSCFAAVGHFAPLVAVVNSSLSKLPPLAN